MTDRRHFTPRIGWTDPESKKRLRTCRTMHHCDVCGASITYGQRYYDGGHGARAHRECGVLQDTERSSAQHKDPLRVIFLDFDGVLNSHEYVKSPRHPKNASIGIDPVAVERLWRITKATGAKIVVSSTWRIGATTDHLSGLLRACGFWFDVIGVTPDLVIRTGGLYEPKCRGDEIQFWLDNNGPVDTFVIIDDDSDMAHLTPHLIQTSFDDGLQDKHVVLAIKRLSGDGLPLDSRPDFAALERMGAL